MFISFILAIFVEVEESPIAEVALLSISLTTTVPPTATFLATSTDTAIPQMLAVFSELTDNLEVFVAVPVTEPP